MGVENEYDVENCVEILNSIVELKEKKKQR